jgi:hypothetical protein
MAKISSRGQKGTGKQLLRIACFILSPLKTIVNKWDFNLCPMIFPVGIVIAKAAWVNHSHAWLHTIHRSRMSGGN